jgi:hypothetical protein
MPVLGFESQLHAMSLGEPGVVDAMHAAPMALVRVSFVFVQ